MKPNTQRLIKMYAFPKSFAQEVTEEDIEREKEEFFKRLLPALDQQLKDKPYFAGQNLTAADLLYYNEIVTVVMLSGRELGADLYANLSGWFANVKALPEV